MLAGFLEPGEFFVFVVEEKDQWMSVGRLPSWLQLGQAPE